MFHSVLPSFRLDARRNVSTRGKAPGKPCGSTYISAKYNCSEENSKRATARLKGNKVERSKYAARVRKAKGLSPSGPREKQMAQNLSKMLGLKEFPKLPKRLQSNLPLSKSKNNILKFEKPSFESVAKRSRENLEKAASKLSDKDLGAEIKKVSSTYSKLKALNKKSRSQKKERDRRAQLKAFMKSVGLKGSGLIAQAKLGTRLSALEDEQFKRKLAKGLEKSKDISLAEIEASEKSLKNRLRKAGLSPKEVESEWQRIQLENQHGDIHLEDL